VSRLPSGSTPRSKRSCASYSSIVPGFVALEGPIRDGSPRVRSGPVDLRCTVTIGATVTAVAEPQLGPLVTFVPG
jgi:hypothetical protein